MLGSLPHLNKSPFPYDKQSLCPLQASVSSLCSSISLKRYSALRLDPSLYSLTALDCIRIAVTAEAQRGKSPGLGWQRVEHEVSGGVMCKPGQLTLV